MAILFGKVRNTSQLSTGRPVDRVIEEASLSGHLNLNGRKLKEFPCIDKFDLTDIVFADLSKNRFGEFPNGVINFWYVEYLNLHHNAIKSIPDTVLSLQCLVYLDISHNQLLKLPSSLCRLPLEILLVSNNRLQSLPIELGSCKTLTELDVSNNQISQLPATQLAQLTSLKSLNVRSNLLMELPIEMTKLRLSHLNISRNRISCLPVELKDMSSSLETLYLSENPLMAPPAVICARGMVHVFKWLELRMLSMNQKKDLRKQQHSHHSRGSTTGSFTWSSTDKSNTPTGSLSTISVTSKVSQETLAFIDAASSLKADGSSLESRFDYDSEKTVAEIGGGDCGTFITNNSNVPTSYLSTTPHAQTYREYKESKRQQRTVDDIYKSSMTTPSVSPTPIQQSQHNFKKSGAQYSTKEQKPSSPASILPVNFIASSSVLAHRQSLIPEPVQREKEAYDTLKRPVQKVSPSVNKSGCSSVIKGKQLQSNIGENSTIITLEKQAASESGSLVTSSLRRPRVPVTETKTSTFPKPSSCSSSLNPSKLQFTMRREYEKAKEEAELIKQLRINIESRLKMNLPDDLSAALNDGVVLCHFANHVMPRSVASIHVPSPTVPKLTMARSSRNVNNFLEACRKIGVDEKLICCAGDILEGKGLAQIAVTVNELLHHHNPKFSAVIHDD